MNWEDYFEELDKDKEWNDFCNEWGPGGMINIDDDNLQSFIAKLIKKYVDRNNS